MTISPGRCYQSPNLEWFRFKMLQALTAFLDCDLTCDPPFFSIHLHENTVSMVVVHRHRLSAGVALCAGSQLNGDPVGGYITM